MTLLEMAIGLVFILAFLSLICASVQELISTATRERAETLKEGIRTLLLSPGAASSPTLTAFYQHPLIRALSRTGDPATDHPSYIPSRVFAAAVVDHVIQQGQDAAGRAQQSVAAFNAGLQQLAASNQDFARLLNVVTSDVTSDFELLKTKVAAYFDTTMERVSGWYKRHVFFILIWVSLVVTVATNADLFMIGDIFAKNATLRAAVVQTAETVAAHPADNTQTATRQLAVVLDATADLKLPLGWSRGDGARAVPSTLLGWARKVLGLLTTTACLCLGAPFWFDALKGLVSLRGTGVAPKPAGTR